MMKLPFLNPHRDRIEEALDQNLTDPETPDRLLEAMRYSVLGGGKRFRGLLCILGASIFADPAPEIYDAAAAIEMVHAYSLIHDDLPCMDDDDFRRGKPSCHKAFGDAVAVLAGDALLTRAFEILVSIPVAEGSTLLACTRDLARAAGPSGMVGGQILDMQSPGQGPNPDRLRRTHSLKTGTLIRASVIIGGRLAGAGEDPLRRLADFGEKLGLAFQITDDLLDVEGTPEETGKGTGRDSERGKATYPGLFGTRKTQAMAADAIRQAETALSPLGQAAVPLRKLARSVFGRSR